MAPLKLDPALPKNLKHSPNGFLREIVGVDLNRQPNAGLSPKNTGIRATLGFSNLVVQLRRGSVA
jgi:hypothetical protein